MTGGDLRVDSQDLWNRPVLESVLKMILEKWMRSMASDRNGVLRDRQREDDETMNGIGEKHKNHRHYLASVIDTDSRENIRNIIRSRLPWLLFFFLNECLSLSGIFSCAYVFV